MFSLFTSKPPVEDKKAKAREAYEKVASLRTDSREARSARLRMGLLCRAHIDKTFIDGAEQTADWQDLASAAAARGQELPEPPAADCFQVVGTGTGAVTVYLPEETAEDVFALGARYQKAEISAEQAIDAVQVLADQLFRFELRLDEKFEVLKFLRDELSGDDGAAEAEPSPSAA